MSSLTDAVDGIVLCFLNELSLVGGFHRVLSDNFILLSGHSSIFARPDDWAILAFCWGDQFVYMLCNPDGDTSSSKPYIT